MKSLLYQIRSHKLAYALNLLGLSIAFAAFYLFATQVEFNRTYNHNIKHYERIYRMEINGFTQNEEWSCYLNRTFEVDMKGIAHVEDVVSHNMMLWYTPVYVGENQFNNIMSTQISDSGLEFFGVKMLLGTSHYTSKTQAVITKSVAERLFGTTNAIGRTFSIPQVKSLTTGESSSSTNTVSGEGELEVIGIAEDIPANCFLFNGIYLGLKDSNIDLAEEWSYITYVRLDSPNNKEEVEASIRKIMMDAYGYTDWKKFKEKSRLDIRLNCLDETYFSGACIYDKGNRNLVNIIFWSAIFVLIVRM